VNKKRKLINENEFETNKKQKIQDSEINAISINITNDQLNLTSFNEENTKTPEIKILEETKEENKSETPETKILEEINEKPKEIEENKTENQIIEKKQEEEVTKIETPEKGILEDDEEIDENFVCAICCEIYHKCISIIPCLHNFCSCKYFINNSMLFRMDDTRRKHMSFL
jgi:hypothetical protein